MMFCLSGSLPAPGTTSLTGLAIINFRHFLEKYNAEEQTPALFNDKLKQAELMLSQGITIDATIAIAPCSVKNKSGHCDPEMDQARKGNQWYSDMKAHITLVLLLV